jgi:hypothetical protein
MRDNILDAIERHIAKRSNMDPRLYNNDRAAFMGDYRPMLRDGKDARTMLAYIRPRASIDAAALVAAMGNGRMQYDAARKEMDYCVGQYWATEYRAAACRVLASAIKAFLSDGASLSRYGIRAAASRELGRGIARRWFS